MKNLFVAFVIMLSAGTGTTFGQKFFLNNGVINGGTVTGCSGKFYDSNPDGTYGPNENYTITFCSGSSSKIIQVIFSTISIAAGDTLFSYDGNNVNAPVIDTFTNSFQNSVSFTPSLFNTSGCITFRFVSDSTDEKGGWEGDIKCIYPCKQKILGTTITSPDKDAIGYTNVCFGEVASFSLKTQYPDNDLTYHQADSSSTFHWVFGDGKDTSGKNLLSVKHIYSTAGGFYARVTVIDSNGCSNYQPIRIPVRTSLKPVFNITPPSAICLLDTAVVKPSGIVNGQNSVTSRTGSFVSMPVSGDSVFLPDNPPQCFSSSVVIEQFAPNQTLQNLNDLEGIFMNVEHSYLGDLTISVEAPNGAKVFLKTTVEGSPNDGTFLGEPVDESLWGDPTDNNFIKIRGKGYQYSFSNSPEHGTMWNEVSKYSYSYIDNSGRQVVDHYYLPAGSYKSEESMNPLIGTPLNGKWTIEICDKQAIDNGFVFNWRIEFKKSVFPNAETYTIPAVTQTWTAAPGIVATKNTTAFISPPSSGTFAYTYHVADAFGCNYDSTIQLIVNPIPAKPNLGADTTICTGRSITIKDANFSSINNYHWNTNQKEVPNIIISQPGTYWIEASNNKGCKNRDSIKVLLFNPFTVNLGNDNLLCAARSINLTPVASTTITSWKWNTGATSTNYSTNTPGFYWVEAKDAGGCLVRDTILVSNNPVSVFELPNDTTICDKSSYLLTLAPLEGTQVVWNDSSTSYSRTINKAGTYKVTANYKGCVHQTEMVVKVNPLPVFHLGSDTTICNGYTLPLKASFPGASYRWSTGTSDSVYIVAKGGVYWAEATAGVCFYRDTIKVQQKVCACEVKMPNAFSPNGDGINDFFKPSMQCIPKEYHLSVFNRDGQLVFESKDYQHFWDGKWNGKPLPIATYYYILTLFNEDLMQGEKNTGSITLLR